VPTVERVRALAAPPGTVWAVVGDLHRFAAWWPRTERVEGVTEEGFTFVLRTPKGKIVRADHRLVASEPERRLAWSLVALGTPWERLVRTSDTEVRLAPDGAGTEVTLAGVRRLRGINWLGGWAVRKAMVREYDVALENLAALLGDPAGAGSLAEPPGGASPAGSQDGA
jgi:uncharacterized protein YndB with AHSA1/START domain